jgi:hypothetical protein
MPLQDTIKANKVPALAILILLFASATLTSISLNIQNALELNKMLDEIGSTTKGQGRPEPIDPSAFVFTH